nr:Biomphalaria glabrata C1q-related factor-like [Biomphalaria glabrata]
MDFIMELAVSKLAVMMTSHRKLDMKAVLGLRARWSGVEGEQSLNDLLVWVLLTYSTKLLTYPISIADLLNKILLTYPTGIADLPNKIVDLPNCLKCNLMVLSRRYLTKLLADQQTYRHLGPDISIYRRWLKIRTKDSGLRYPTTNSVTW